MLRDVGSRDDEFIALVAGVRRSLLELASVSTAAGYEAIPMQGTGTFGIEAVLWTAVARSERLLVVSNGHYGDRIAAIAEKIGIDTHTLETAPDRIVSATDVAEMIETDPSIAHVAVVHCETSSGILNDIVSIGRVCRERGKGYIVDSMSAYGAVPIDMAAAHVDYLISSSNKCIEGVPGFCVVLARRDALVQARGRRQSTSLDLVDQWRQLESNGQFRFTPPTHAFLAFDRALAQLAAEGGPASRRKRYRRNRERLVAGMTELGFRPYLSPDVQSDVIVSFMYPSDPAFDFTRFYWALAGRGCVIYPGKLTAAHSFRIGTAGDLELDDFDVLLSAIAEVIAEQGFRVAGEGGAA